MKTVQLIKTFNGYKVVYHSDYKINPYVITRNGKVVTRYEDLKSCAYWIFTQMPIAIEV